MHVLTTAPALPTGTLEPSARRSSRCPRACAGVPNTAPVEAGAPRQRSISRRPCAPTCFTRLCPTASAALLLLLLLAVVLVLLVVLLLATCWR